MVRTPHGFCCAAGLGNEKLAKSIFWYFFYENPNPDATFFVYVKLLISLLNIEFFRLGENFSLRDHGAIFLATPYQQLLKQIVGTPTSRFGEFCETFAPEGNPNLASVDR